MHIRFKQHSALEAIRRITPVLPKNNLLPALRGILLEAQEGSTEVTAIAQNALLCAKITFDADIVESGTLLFDGVLLAKIIEHFGSPDAEIQTSDCDSVLIASGPTRYLLSAQDAAVATERRSQIGSGDRSERIRTYNFPQGRVTDHRIGLTLYRLEQFLDGDMDELIDALIVAERAEKLSARE